MLWHLKPVVNYHVHLCRLREDTSTQLHGKLIIMFIDVVLYVKKCRHEFRRVIRMHYLLMKRKKAIQFGLLFFLILTQQNTFAQHVHDSVYYKTFPNVLTVRVYTVKDYAHFSFASLTKRSGIHYKSNATTNLGA